MRVVHAASNHRMGDEADQNQNVNHDCHKSPPARLAHSGHRKLNHLRQDTVCIQSVLQNPSLLKFFNKIRGNQQPESHWNSHCRAKTIAEAVRCLSRLVVQTLSAETLDELHYDVSPFCH